jgi:hypothetical protein
MLLSDIFTAKSSALAPTECIDAHVPSTVSVLPLSFGREWRCLKGMARAFTGRQYRNIARCACAPHVRKARHSETRNASDLIERRSREASIDSRVTFAVWAFAVGII